jgi:hypothetical protein
MARAGVPEPLRRPLAKPEIALCGDRPADGRGRALWRRSRRRRLRSVRLLPPGAERPRAHLGCGRSKHQKVCPGGVSLIFPAAGRGRPRKKQIPDQIAAAAETMSAAAKRKEISWRRGVKGSPSARFSALRIRIADGPPRRILDQGQRPRSVGFGPTASFLAATDDESADARDLSISPAKLRRSGVRRWILSRASVPPGSEPSPAALSPSAPPRRSRRSAQARRGAGISRSPRSERHPNHCPPSALPDVTFHDQAPAQHIDVICRGISSDRFGNCRPAASLGDMTIAFGGHLRAESGRSLERGVRVFGKRAVTPIQALRLSSPRLSLNHAGLCSWRKEFGLRTMCERDYANLAVHGAALGGRCGFLCSRVSGN